MQLNTGKCAFLSGDGTNETHGADHVTGDIYGLTQVDLAARAFAGRKWRRHPVKGVVSTQYTGDSVAFTVIRNGGKGSGSQSCK